MKPTSNILRIGAIAAAAAAVPTLFFTMGDMINALPFASKDQHRELRSEVVVVSEDLIEVASKAQTNRILILNDRLQRALAEKRGYEQNKKPIPQSLEEWIRDLCQKLKEEGSGCR